MNGDLGNLLAGEMGEAEARFGHDDFAEAYGRRIAGRVRRRRTVRAVGVGGGTMLTAGALVVGATHMPWGVLGAAPGAGGTDCVTPSPSDGSFTYEVTVRAGNTPTDTVSLLDNATGAAILTAALQPDGSYVFTDAEGNPLKATLETSGSYRVTVSQAPTADAQWGTAPSGGAEIVVEGISTSDFANPSGATPTPSDDCYTPSPAPSGVPSLSTEIFHVTDPSLAAKPEDVTSPFQCGFTFPTESSKTDGLWIDGAQRMTGTDAAAAIRASFTSDPSQAPGVGNLTGLVPVVTVHFANTITDSGLAVAFGTTEPSMVRIPTAPTDSATDWVASEGATYVGVVDGRVVATGTVPPDGSTTNAPPIYADWGGFPEAGARIYLLDETAALKSCDANPVDSSRIDLYAVAGSIVEHPDGTVVGPTYAWIPVGKP
ncbi:hypothetical protein [Demequina lutea]|uniref:Uncharacterized protein n=1 Tax=Demequina lutea TaxID=431489 RepID=A0A7Z0CIP3_9MICO|nr:hypothetical protein [Demequina lutea]NYI42796.1 hypothetical protein [Demequina lutea]